MGIWIIDNLCISSETDLIRIPQVLIADNLPLENLNEILDMQFSNGF